MAPSPNDRHAPSSPADDEGVRILRKPGSRFGFEASLAAGVALTVGVVVAVSLWTSGGDAPAVGDPMAPSAGASLPSATTAMGPAHPKPERAVQRLEASPSATDFSTRAPGGDANDLASYFRPGDPVPSTANLIKAMNEAGIRSGIAAFNPPGTSPPLEGLAVPPDFELPPGYVRHHQATDEGDTIEPILMFSPDLVLRDAAGRTIELPTNRVVPPELAPPGLPLRWVRPGKP
ncbi:hypothetical protein [Silanimonas sp.]|jgi:hypothetical protein|uniref:hypothetical protein n=1 Tax=Silanimonas sp. TaxID=1929290 RepID=UPI0022C772B7|nr:hypothetical protein [Silanimonas sp.]MCZ8116149.1 hypothetical protein [Silanimonas sp.]